MLLPSQRRGGCGINKSRKATEEAADGREARARQREAVIVVSSAKCLGLHSFAALTTPAAPISERIHFIDGASIPLLCEEGNISCISQHCQFIHTLYGRRPSLTCCLPALILLMRLRAVALALRGAPLQLHSDVR